MTNGNKKGVAYSIGRFEVRVKVVPSKRTLRLPSFLTHWHASVPLQPFRCGRHCHSITVFHFPIIVSGLDINHWPAGPAGVFHSGGQSGQWTKESAGPKGPAIISSDHKVFVLHWPEV